MTSIPVNTPLFLALSTERRSRIYLLTAAEGSPPAALEQVTTLADSATDAAALVQHLNSSVSSGDQSSVEHYLTDLPEAVALACRRALERAASSVGLPAVPSDLPVVREFFATSPDEIVEHLQSGITLGLQFLVTNGSLPDDVRLKATLFGDELEVPYTPSPQWLPAPNGAPLLDRTYPSEDDLLDVFRDPVWETFVSRAYWLWVQEEDDPDSASATIVVEHFDQLIDDSKVFLRFAAEDDSDTEGRGPLSPRNRFELYITLLAMTTDLDTLLSDWGEDVDSVVRDDMPLTVLAQPREWWVPMRDAADRLFAAARTGALHDLEPRTVGEEVLIALATRTSYVEWGRDTADLMGVTAKFNSLPTDPEWDGKYEEILPHLVGDVDVEMLWDRRLDGIEDPEDPTNAFLLMGDFRPAAWHDVLDETAEDVDSAED